MANDYCTATQIKAVMPDTAWDTSYDTLLATLATRASRMLDRALGREPGAFYSDTDTVRYFDGNGMTGLWVDELISVTSIQVAEGGDLNTLTTWGSTDYLLWPYNAAAEGRPYLRIDVDDLYGSKSYWPRYRKAVKITGKFGYSDTTPDEVTQAAIILAVRHFKRGQQGFQDVGAVTDLGQLRYVNQVDPDVMALVSHLRRVTI